MSHILVLYYSQHGSTKNLAYKIAQGIEAAGATALLRTVPPVSNNLQHINSAIPIQGDPYVTNSELTNCIGLALGSPTRFGNMSSAMKYFWDGTVNEWISGTLTGKPACVFTSSSSMHGGQESTLLTMMLPLMHHGMVIAGLPYSESELHDTITGGTPYGVSHVSGKEGQSSLSEHESRLAIAQGKRLAGLAHKLIPQSGK